MFYNHIFIIRSSNAGMLIQPIKVKSYNLALIGWLNIKVLIIDFVLENL